MVRPLVATDLFQISEHARSLCREAHHQSANRELLGDGVTVAQQILVLFVQVRILVAQLSSREASEGLVYRDSSQKQP